MGRIGDFIQRIGHGIMRHLPRVSNGILNFLGVLKPPERPRMSGINVPPRAVPTVEPPVHYIQNPNPPHNPYEAAPAPAPPPAPANPVRRKIPPRPDVVHFVRGGNNQT